MEEKTENQKAWLGGGITLREYAKRENRYIGRLSLSTNHLTKAQKESHEYKPARSTSVDALLTDRLAQGYRCSLRKNNSK